jgi:hypothetical protein
VLISTFLFRHVNLSLRLFAWTNHVLISTFLFQHVKSSLHLFAWADLNFSFSTRDYLLFSINPIIEKCHSLAGIQTVKS